MIKPSCVLDNVNSPFNITKNPFLCFSKAGRETKEAKGSGNLYNSTNELWHCESNPGSVEVTWNFAIEFVRLEFLCQYLKLDEICFNLCFSRGSL